MIAVSLNIGGGVRNIRSSKLYTCMQLEHTTHITRTEAQQRVCAAMAGVDKQNFIYLSGIVLMLGNSEIFWFSLYILNIFLHKLEKNLLARQKISTCPGPAWFCTTEPLGEHGYENWITHLQDQTSSCSELRKNLSVYW